MISSSDLKRILAREHGRLSKILAVVAYADKPVRVKDVVQIASDHGFRKMKEWNVSHVLANSRGKALLIGGTWEITDDGKELVAGMLANTGVRPVAVAAIDLRAELAKIRDDTTRAFAEEAIRAYEARLYRSAIVMSWVTALDVLYQAVLNTKRAEFNAEAKRVNSSWREVRDRDGLSLMKEREFLDRAAAVGLVGKNVKAALIECLDRRNGCGHPNSLKLKGRAVAHHLEVLVLNVFQVFGAPALSLPPPASATGP